MSPLAAEPNGYLSEAEVNGQVSATAAFIGWKNSPLHNAVIFETGTWDGMDFPAMLHLLLK